MGYLTPEGMTRPSYQDFEKWPKPNFVNPQTREWVVIGVEAPLTFIAAMFVAARFYARTIIKRVLGWDDWLMLASMFLAATIAILHCLSTQYATGLHIWDVKFAWVAPTGKLTYATMVLFAPTASLAKLSLSITHLRILPSTSDRVFARVAIIFSILYGISITLVMIFQCNPIASYWDPRATSEYSCVDERAFNYSAQALNSASDFLIFLWPIRTLWTVRVPVKQRLGLVFVFSIGAIVCIAGVFRIYYLYRYFHSYDVYWEAAMVFVCAGIETNVGIICGCLPGIKPLLNRMFPKTFAAPTDSRTFQEFSRRRRLPGARLSIHPPPPAHFHRPSSGSMVEVPIKLDQHWNPLESPSTVVPFRVLRPEETVVHDVEREAGTTEDQRVPQQVSFQIPHQELQQDLPQARNPENHAEVEPQAEPESDPTVVPEANSKVEPGAERHEETHPGGHDEPTLEPQARIPPHSPKPDNETHNNHTQS